jgi:hypothetical protein
MRRLAALLVVVALGFPGAAAAQQPEQAAPVDASKMGVSLDRIRRELRQAEAREQEPGTINLRFHVEVFGQAPRLDLFKDFPLDVGPVPYGGPTHRDVVEYLTPQQFRSPAIGISNLAVWAAQKLHERSKKGRCEREIAEYRALIMQGVAVAAPTCAQ